MRKENENFMVKNLFSLYSFYNLKRILKANLSIFIRVCNIFGNIIRNGNSEKLGDMK